MRSRWRGLLAAVCVSAAAGFFCAGLWLHSRKYAQSGVAVRHMAIRDEGGYFSVARGGGHRQPITADQYRAWEDAEQAAWAAMGLSVPFLTAGIGLGSIARGRPDAEPNAADVT